MILLNDLNLAFGEQHIFENVSGSFTSRQKIGVVGRNGMGKSTLLKVISGMQKLDSGQVSIEKNARIAYMPQELVMDSTKSVREETLSACQDLLALEQERIDIEHQLTSGESEDPAALVERYSELQEILENLEPHKLKLQAEEILKGLGFSNEQIEQPVNELSVGWKMRVVLAKLLLQNADFYLFDEPTNHLDITSKQWFFEFIKQGQFGFLLVTHDRYFLENACTQILEVDRGRATRYYGNYTAYLTQKEEARLRIASSYERQQKEIAQKKATIERFKASASRASMAQSMIKQLEKIEVIEPEPTMPTVRFSFPPVVRAGAIALKVEGVSQSFGTKTIFKDVSFELMRGKKGALVAPNGAGKTTLFSIITGKLPLQSGTVTFGHNVTPAIFEQDQSRVLDPRKSVLDEVQEAVPKATTATVRGFLGNFLFSGDDVHKRTGVLSGGEKNRVAMVKVLLQNSNLLLLDEPTNHLDLVAKEVLLQGLTQYEGSMLFVSHDQDFLNKLATDIYELTPTGVHRYEGNYEAYLYAKKLEREALEKAAGAQPKKNEAKPVEKPSPEAAIDRKKEAARLEQLINKKEQELTKLSAQFEGMVYGKPEYTKTAEKITAVQKEIAELTEKWEKLA